MVWFVTHTWMWSATFLKNSHVGTSSLMLTCLDLKILYSKLLRQTVNPNKQGILFSILMIKSKCLLSSRSFLLTIHVKISSCMSGYQKEILLPIFWKAFLVSVLYNYEFIKKKQKKCCLLCMLDCMSWTFSKRHECSEFCGWDSLDRCRVQ